MHYPSNVVKKVTLGLKLLGTNETTQVSFFMKKKSNKLTDMVKTTTCEKPNHVFGN